MNSIFKKDYGSTSFITGIRAFAAMAVVLIHAGGAGLRNLGSFGNNIVNFGQAGVYVFFEGYFKEYFFPKRIEIFQKASV